MLCADPAPVVGRESAGGNHAVDMRMEQKVLTPGVKDREEPDLRSEVFGVGCRFQHGLRGGREQQVVEQCRVGQCQRVQFMGNGEHDVEVTGVEQFLLPCLKPSLACLSRSHGVGGGLLDISIASGVHGFHTVQRVFEVRSRDKNRIDLLPGVQLVVVAQRGDGISAELLDIGSAFLAAPIPQIGDCDQFEVQLFGVLLKCRDQ